MGLLDRPALSSSAPPGVPPSCGSSSSMRRGDAFSQAMSAGNYEGQSGTLYVTQTSVRILRLEHQRISPIDGPQ